MSKLKALIDPSLLKALFAAGWMYGGRGLGLIWTVSSIAKLGIGEYGQYAMGLAVAAIIAAPIDYPFTVRSLREPLNVFRSERTTRVMLGITLMIAGVALIPTELFIVWFALIVAGGEVSANAYRSQALRDGHPEQVMRLTTARQASAIALAMGYLYIAPHPTLMIASLLYVAPYFVLATLAAIQTRGAKPKVPGGWREIGLLFSENLANAIYGQGDVLLLGLLTNSTIAGYYSVASVTAFAIAYLGQAFSHTFHEKLRVADGNMSAGPPLKQITVLSLAAGLLMLLAGVVVLFLPASSSIAWSMIIMSVMVTMRSMNFIFTTILYIQHRDKARVGVALVLAPLKMALVYALYHWGAEGAAFAAVITDAVLLVWYLRALYQKPTRARHSISNNLIVKRSAPAAAEAVAADAVVEPSVGIQAAAMEQAVVEMAEYADQHKSRVSQ